MTIDEAIKHSEEVAEEHTRYNRYGGFESWNDINCTECAKEHRQLANWLKELKQLREQEPCEDCISRANALRVAKNEYLRGWHNALCKALSEKYSIHCEEGNFSVIQEETITGLGLSMDCAVGKDVENYMSALPSVTLTRKKGKWIFRGNYDEEGILYCSNCQHEVDVSEGYFKYCPNCGAKMES